MAVFKFSNVGGFGTYQRYNDFLAGNPAVIADKGSMYPLGVFTLSSAQASIEFTNIPQTYTHLQIRGIAINTNGANGTYVVVRVNSDSATNYNYHTLTGQGTAALSTANTSTSFIEFGPYSSSSNNSYPNSYIADVLDYKNTNKFKTFRVLTGTDNNGSGSIDLRSGLWRSTSAVTSITLLAYSQGSPSNFGISTSFALYGVQA